MKKKRLIIIISVIVLIAIITAIVVIVIKNVNKGKNTENTEEQVNNENSNVEICDSPIVNKEIDFEGLKLNNIRILSKDSKTDIFIDVTNESGKDIDIKPIKVTLYDKDNNEIVTLNGIINPTKANETSEIYISSSLNYTDAYDIKVENLY